MKLLIREVLPARSYKTEMFSIAAALGSLVLMLLEYSVL